MVPEELQRVSQWIAWWSVRGEGKRVKLPDGSMTRRPLKVQPKAHKLPINPHTGGLASTTDPATWGKFEQAVAAVERYGVTGIGFVFTDHDPYGGVDLDDCRDPVTGDIAQWAMRIIEKLNSYTEVSPSKKGVKAFVRSKLPIRRGNQKVIETGKCEMFSRERYFTLTGEHLVGTPTSVEGRQTELLALHAELFAPKRGNSKPHARPAPTFSASDSELLTNARSAANGDKFRRLFDDGHWKNDYPSQSEADLALCGMLAFWTGGDAARIDALFRQSALVREKWERDDYRESTIGRAITATANFYTGLFNAAQHPLDTPNGRTQMNEPGDAQTRHAESLPETDEDAPPAAKPLPRIQVNDRQLREYATDSLRELRRANTPTPKLFVRSGELVTVAEDEKRRPVIRPVTENHLRALIGQVADYHTRCNKKGEVVEAACPPPPAVVKEILSLSVGEMWTRLRLEKADLPFPALESIVETPILRPDGTALLSPGYDPATRAIYVPRPGLKIPPFPVDPITDEVAEAVELLDDALGDFPFADAASKANAFALLFTPIIRHAINGHVPLALVDAPQAGTGKGLLSEVVTMITTGDLAAMKPVPGNEDEWRKTITAELLDGPSMIIFDNLEATLHSAQLASALTSSSWKDRVLGLSKTVTLSQRAVWVVTGNNIRLGGDLPRRCYWIRLDAKMSKPWKRSGFRHPDLKGWAGENRGRLLAALLTIARAWFVVGKPDGNSPVLGSFENWCRTVGGILSYAKIPGFLSNLEDMYASSDDSAGQWEAFLRELRDVFGEAIFTVADVIRHITPLAPGETTALSALTPDDLIDVKGGKVNSRRVGWAFARRNQTRYGEDGIHLERNGDRKDVVQWRVVLAK